MLGVAIVKGTARVSIAVVLAVNYSALYCFLNLREGLRENVRKFSLNHSTHNLIKTTNERNNFPFLQLYLVQMFFLTSLRRMQ